MKFNQHVRSYPQVEAERLREAWAAMETRGQPRDAYGRFVSRTDRRGRVRYVARRHPVAPSLVRGICGNLPLLLIVAFALWVAVPPSAWALLGQGLLVALQVLVGAAAVALFVFALGMGVRQALRRRARTRAATEAAAAQRARDVDTARLRRDEATLALLVAAPGEAQRAWEQDMPETAQLWWAFEQTAITYWGAAMAHRGNVD